MSEMVEMVAKAMCDALPSLGTPQSHMVQGLARAAIEAMREPTEEMMVSAEDAFPMLLTFADKEESGSYIAWRAMIDTALK